MDLGDFLLENLQYSQIVAHSFSIGAYLSGECFRNMDEKDVKYGKIFDRFVGFIGDSLVDLESVRENLLQHAFPKSPGIVKLINPFYQYFFDRFHDAVAIYFIRATEASLNWKRMVPSLMITSRKDPLANTPRINEILHNWTLRGCRLTWKRFDDSPHVAHFFKHNEAYKKCLLEFLESLNLRKISKDLKSKM